MKSKRHSINKNETLWRVRELKSDNDTKLFSKKEDAVEFARKRVIEIEKKMYIDMVAVIQPIKGKKTEFNVSYKNDNRYPFNKDLELISEPILNSSAPQTISFNVMKIDKDGKTTNTPNLITRRKKLRDPSRKNIAVWRYNETKRKLVLHERKTGTVHVFYNIRGSWSVKKEGSKRAAKVMNNREDAIEKGREICEKSDLVLFIHNKDGSVNKKIDCSN